MRDWLRLLRVPLAPTAAFDVVAATLLALAAGGHGAAALGPGAWLLLPATSLLVYGAGMAGNDWADRRRDRTLAPDRPLPAGRIGPRAAGGVVLLLAAAAVLLGGGPAGSRPAVLVAVGAAAAYDLGGKRHLVAGAALMGLVRAANAAMAVVVLVEAGAAPAWSLLGPAAIGLQSAATTVLSTTEERPSLARAIAARVVSATAFAIAGALSVVAAGRLTLGAFLAAMVVSSVAFGRRPRPGPVKRQVLEMLLGLYVLAACLASAARGPAWLVAVLALAAAWAASVLSQLAIRALRPRPAAPTAQSSSGGSRSGSTA